MTARDWLALVAIFVCLLLAAFFAGGETALAASSRGRMSRLEKQGNREAAVVSRLLATREHFVAALRLGSGMVTAIAACLAASLFLLQFGELGVIYAIVLMAVFVILAEGLPRTAAARAPDRLALAVAEPMHGLVRLFAPLLKGIERLMNLSGRPGSAQRENPPVIAGQEEPRAATDVLRIEVMAEEQDRAMLEGLLDLRELEVSDVMRHRTDMFTLNAEDPPSEILRAILAAPVTRVPLWRGTPENIVGVLHAKDVLRALQAHGGEADKIDIQAIASPPWFVPDTTPLAEQLKAFRRHKSPLALVVDEYGQVMGLVTLQDILEEIVGDMADEHEMPLTGVRPQPSGAVNVDGSVTIRDLNRVMNWDLPDEDATTIAGLVIHESRSIPEPGQTFTFHGFRFQVLRRSRNRITALRITPLVQKPAAAGPLVFSEKGS